MSRLLQNNLRVKIRSFWRSGNTFDLLQDSHSPVNNWELFYPTLNLPNIKHLNFIFIFYQCCLFLFWLRIKAWKNSWRDLNESNEDEWKNLFIFVYLCLFLLTYYFKNCIKWDKYSQKNIIKQEMSGNLDLIESDFFVDDAVSMIFWQLY